MADIEAWRRGSEQEHASGPAAAGHASGSTADAALAVGLARKIVSSRKPLIHPPNVRRQWECSGQQLHSIPASEYACLGTKGSWLVLRAPSQPISEMLQVLGTCLMLLGAPGTDESWCG